MRILILTDSLALPRTTPEMVAFEDTWVELLKQQYPMAVFHQLSIGGAKIGILWEQFFYHKNFRPDICIIQSGIVDCSPRAFTEFEQFLINSNRVTRKLGNMIIPKIKGFLRRSRYIQSTPIKKYSKIMSDFHAQNKHTIAIGIVPAVAEYEKKVPGITNNIQVYNSSLKQIFQDDFIDMSDIDRVFVMSDYHHLNSDGHRKLFEKLKSKLADQ